MSQAAQTTSKQIKCNLPALVTLLGLALAYVFSSQLLPKLFPPFNRWLEQSRVAIAAAKEGPTAQALAALETVHRDAPTSGEVRYWMANLLERAGATNRAVPHYQRLLTIDDTGPFVVRARQRLKELNVRINDVTNPVHTLVIGYDSSVTNAARQLKKGATTIPLTTVEWQRSVCGSVKAILAFLFGCCVIRSITRAASEGDVILLGVGILLLIAGIFVSPIGRQAPQSLLLAILCVTFGWANNKANWLASLLYGLDLFIECQTGLVDNSWRMVVNGWTPPIILLCQASITVISLIAVSYLCKRAPEFTRGLVALIIVISVWDLIICANEFLSSNFAFGLARTLSLLSVLAGVSLNLESGELADSQLLGMITNFVVSMFWCVVLPIAAHTIVFLVIMPEFCAQSNMTMPSSFWENPVIRWGAHVMGAA